MLHRRLACAAVACAGLVGGLVGGVAHADPLTDALDARAMGSGEALRASSQGQDATVLNPAGLALTRAYVIQGSYGFRPADSASLASASVCDSTVRVGACAFYDFQTTSPSPSGGANDHTLHVLGLTLGTALSDKLLVGMTTKWVKYTEGTPSDSNSRDGAIMVDAGAILRVAQQVNVGVAGYNLVGHDKGEFARGVGAGVSVFLTPMFLLGADGRWNLETNKGRYSLGAEYVLSTDGGQRGYPIRGGFVYDQAGGKYLTAGLGYLTPKIALDAALRKEVSGGDELVVQVGLRFFLPN